MYGAKPNVPRTALNWFSLGHVELLRGVRKINIGLLEFLHEPKINGLLHIHICPVIGAEHNEDDFVDEREVPKAFEVGPVKSSILVFFDDSPDHLGKRLHLLDGGFVRDADTEDDPPFLHTLVVFDSTAG